MASGVRQELAQLMNSSGSHKDLAGKYVFSSHLPLLVLYVYCMNVLLCRLFSYERCDAADAMTAG